MKCSHQNQIQQVTPSAQGCEECLKTGDWWIHLRICLICGHVGCCDNSPNRHATKHYIPSFSPSSLAKPGAGVMWMKDLSKYP
jgi:hypothetical protein